MSKFRLFSSICFTLAAALLCGTIAEGSQDAFIEGVVLKGQTAEDILKRHMTLTEFHNMYAATKSVYDLRRMRSNFNYELVVDGDGRLRVFAYQFARNKKVVISVRGGRYEAVIRNADDEIIPKGSALQQDSEDGLEVEGKERLSIPIIQADASDIAKPDAVIVRPDAKHAEHDGKGDFSVAEVSRVSPTVEIVVVKGRIEKSLPKALRQKGEDPDALARALAGIFSSEIDFVRGLRKNDTFSIVVQKHYNKNHRFTHYGSILGARLANKGRTHVAYRFPEGRGGAYYDANGRSLRKSVLATPLKFTRISSHYTMARRHPIFHDVRKHQGVDYAAPVGTPVYAVRSGTVTDVGWSGGYGKTVVIKHAGGLESQYAHLSRYAKGLKEGKTVKQGQCIGYVGATGWATGPHLDYRLRKNGVFINPERRVTVPGTGLSGNALKQFRQQKARISSWMDGTSGVKKVSVVTPGESSDGKQITHAKRKSGAKTGVEKRRSSRPSTGKISHRRGKSEKSLDKKTRSRRRK